MTVRYTTAQTEALLEYGVDIPGRRLFLNGDVDEGTIGVIIRGMYMMNTISDTKPVELYVSSYGGEEDDTLALHDVTRTITCPVHTIALGKCMSAAPLLVACGQPGHRYTTENTIFMLHDSYFEVEGRPVQIAGRVKMEQRRAKIWEELLGQYTKKPASHWRAVFSKVEDHYFTAEDAVRWGLVDSLWSEKD